MKIKADRDYMTTVLEKIKNGQIVAPKFQRDFVWSTTQMLDLFDSIIKGFPIGSLILWTPENDKFSIIEEFEGVKIEPGHKSGNDDVCYILDGRQRVTTLISTLFPEGNYSKDFYINLDEMRVLKRGGMNEKRERFENLLLSEAFDSYLLIGYLERLKSSSLSVSKKQYYADRSKQVNRILQSYELGYINVKGGSIDDAVEIFSRLNSKATSISKDYMIQALAYNTDSDFLFGKAISQIRINLTKYNFKDLNRDLILKCVFNHTEKFFIDGKIEDILSMKTSLSYIMKRVEDEIDKTIDFLYTKCGIIDCRLLPYSYQLVLIADFFRINLNPLEKQLLELKKWFFYTTYSNYFTNSSLSKIRYDIRRFRDFAKGQIENPIDYEVLDLTPLPEKFSFRSVRVCCLVASSILKMEANNRKESELVTITLPSVNGKSCVNTIVCASKSESIRIMELLKNGDWEDELEKYNLSEEMVDCYVRNDYQTFMEKRESQLMSVESEMLQSLGLIIKYDSIW